MTEVPDTVDDAIARLAGRPTTDDVFYATLGFSSRELAAAALSGAGKGGYVPNGHMLSRIQVNPTPIGVKFTPDGLTCWVTSDAYGTITPINVRTGVAGTPVNVGGGPYAIAFTPDGTKGYVANSATSNVTPFNPATHVAGSNITTGVSSPSSEPIDVVVTPDGRTCFVVVYLDGTVIPIDVETDTAGDPIAIGTNPNGIILSPDGSTGYVTIGAAAEVQLFDVATGDLGDTIAVGSAPVGIARTSDGTKAYVANSGAGTVTPINLENNTAGTPIPVGMLPVGVAITPDDGLCLVSNSGDGTVTPITVADNTPGEPVPVGANPHFLDIAPDGSVAYVPNKGTDGDLRGSVSRIVALPFYPLNLASPPPPQGATGSSNHFGQATAVTGNWDDIPANYVEVSPWTLTEDGDTVRVRLYLDGNGAGSGNQKLRAVIYTDAAGAPGTIRAVSSEVTITKGAAAAWVPFTCHLQRLTAGIYWVGFIAGASNQVARLNYTSVANSRIYRAHNYVDGAQSPFGTPDATDDKQIAALIDYSNRTSAEVLPF